MLRTLAGENPYDQGLAGLVASWATTPTVSAQPAPETSPAIQE